jgi:hypothetical protein
MRIIRVTPEDLVNTRFSYSPLLELVMSYRVLTRQEHHGLYRRWVEDASQSVFDMEFPYLDALTSGESYIPDFLTPTPLTLVDDIEDELRLLLHTPTEWIQKSVQRLIDADGDSEIRSLFLVYPHELLIRLVEELRVLWVHTLEGHWSHMKSVLVIFCTGQKHWHCKARTNSSPNCIPACISRTARLCITLAGNHGASRSSMNSVATVSSLSRPFFRHAVCGSLPRSGDR